MQSRGGQDPDMPVIGGEVLDGCDWMWDDAVGTCKAVERGLFRMGRKNFQSSKDWDVHAAMTYLTHAAT
jgi:hypothetical protein